MSINRVCLLGRLGQDPEVKRIGRESKLVANLRLACEERWKDRNSGNWEKRTEWVPVVIWGDRLVELVEEYARKGDQIYIEGKFQTRQWEKDGEKRYSTEVVVQGFDGKVELCGAGRKGGSSGDDRSDRSSREDRRGDDRGSDERSFGGGSRGTRSMAADLDDEIPFSPEWRG